MNNTSSEQDHNTTPTPRTDALLVRTKKIVADRVDLIDHACQLEKELSAATRESTQRLAALLAAQERVRELEMDARTLFGQVEPPGSSGGQEAETASAPNINAALHHLQADGAIDRGYIANTIRSLSQRLEAAEKERDTLNDILQSYRGTYTREKERAEAAETALQAAREECAKLCDDYAAAKWAEYKRGPGPGRADPHVQGQSDGAEECAAAIRAIKP